jgi:ribosomal protein S1
MSSVANQVKRTAHAPSRKDDAKRSRVKEVASVPAFLLGEEEETMLPRGQVAVPKVDVEGSGRAAREEGLFDTKRAPSGASKAGSKKKMADDSDDSDGDAPPAAGRGRRGRGDSDDEEVEESALSKAAKAGKQLSDQDRIRLGVEEQVRADMATKRAHTLSFHSLSVGAVVLGAVRSISDLDMVMSLPDGGVGFASLREVSDTMATLVDDFISAGETGPDTEDEDETAGSKKGALPELKSIYAVGQLLRCVVAKLTTVEDRTSGRTYPRIELSLRPSLVNAHLTPMHVQKGAGLVASVSSIEEKGYIVDFGIAGISGFIAKRNAGAAARDLVKGQTVEVVALAPATPENRVVAVTSDPAIVARAGLTQKLAANITYETVKPGVLVSGEVDKVLPDGLLVRFLDFFVGTVSLAHLPQPVLTTADLSLAERFPLGSAVVARVLYVNPATKVIQLSLKTPIVKAAVGAPLPLGLRVGTIVANARIVRTAAEAGVYVDLSPFVTHAKAERDARAAAAGTVAAVDPPGAIVNAATVAVAWLPLREMDDRTPSGLPKKYTKPDAVVTVRVTGCNPLDGYVLVTAKPSVLSCPVMTLEDVVAGQLYEVTVAAHHEQFGVFVQFNPTLKALVPMAHLRDVPLSSGALGKAAEKLPVGAKVTLRVMAVDAATRRISMTAKPALVGTKLPVLTSFAQAQAALKEAVAARRPLLVDATITGVTERGLYIEYYGNLRSYVPTKVLINEGQVVEGQALDKAYTRGQAVRVRIVRADDARQTINCSLKLTPPVRDGAQTEAAAGTTHTPRASRGNTAFALGEWVVSAAVTGLAAPLNVANAAGDVPSDAVLAVTVTKKHPETGVTIEEQALLPAYHLTDHTSSAAHVQALCALHVARRTVFPLLTVVSHLRGTAVLSAKPSLLAWLAGPAFAAAAPYASKATPSGSVNALFTRALAAAGATAGAVSKRAFGSVADLSVGTHAVGFVRSVSHFGVHVQVGPHTVALVPTLALADSHISDPKAAFHVGQTVEAVVTAVRPAAAGAADAAPGLRATASLRNSDLIKASEHAALERVFDLSFFVERAVLAAHPEAWQTDAAARAAAAAEEEAAAAQKAEEEAAKRADGSDDDSDEDEHKSASDDEKEAAKPAAGSGSGKVPKVGSVIAGATVVKATDTALFLSLPGYPDYTAVALAPYHTAGSELEGRPARGRAAACRVLNVDAGKRIVDVTLRPVLVDGAKKIVAAYAEVVQETARRAVNLVMPEKTKLSKKAAKDSAAAAKEAAAATSGAALSQALAPTALALAVDAVVTAEVLLVTRTHLVVNLPQHRQSLAVAVPFTANLRLAPQSLFQPGAMCQATVRYVPPLVEAPQVGAGATVPLSEDTPASLVVALPVAAEVETRLGRAAASETTFFDATMASNRVRPGMLIQVKPVAVNEAAHTLTVAFGPQGTIAGALVGTVHLTDLVDLAEIPAPAAATAKGKKAKKEAAPASVSALARARELLSQDGLVSARVVSVVVHGVPETRAYRTVAAAEAAAAAAIAAKAGSAAAVDAEAGAVTVKRLRIALSLRPSEVALAPTGVVDDRPVAVVMRPHMSTLAVGTELPAVVTNVDAAGGLVTVEYLPNRFAVLSAAELCGADLTAESNAAAAAAVAIEALSVGDAVRVRVIENPLLAPSVNDASDDDDVVSGPGSDDEEDAKPKAGAAAKKSLAARRGGAQAFVRVALVHPTLNPAGAAGTSPFAVGGPSVAVGSVVRGALSVLAVDKVHQTLHVKLPGGAIALVRAVEIDDSFPENPLSSFSVGATVSELAVLGTSDFRVRNGPTFIGSLRRSRIDPLAAGKDIGLSAAASTVPTAVASGFDPLVATDVLVRADVAAGQLLRGYVEQTALRAGCFVQLSAFAMARVEIRELSDSFTSDAATRFPAGKRIEVRMLSADPAEAGAFPATARRSHVSGANIAALQQLKPFDIVKGVVQRISPSGVVIRLKHTTVAGLARTVQCTDTPKGETAPDLSAHYEPGDKVKAVVISTDVRASRVMLGLRASLFEEAAKRKAAGAAANAKKGAKKGLSGEAEAAALAALGSDAHDADESSDDEFARPVRAPAAAAAATPAAKPAAKVAAKTAAPAAAVAVAPAMQSLFKALALPNVAALKAAAAAEDEEEELVPMSDDEDADAGAQKKSREAKRAARERRQREIDLAERALMEDAAPTSTDDFERLCLRTPNNSLVWVQYMAYELELSNVGKARAIAERALKTISAREVQERWNVWVSLLTLENMYGSSEALDAVVKRAQQMNPPVKVALELARIYDQSGKVEKAEEAFAAAAKRWGGEAGGDEALQIWYAWFSLLFKYSLADKARTVLQQALIKLPAKQHLSAIGRFAQLEFQDAAGLPDRGRMMYEKYLSSNPKALDVWAQFVDQEIKLARRLVAAGSAKPGEVKKAKARVRALFDRLTAEQQWKVWTPRQMKFLFKKYVTFEEELDEGKRVADVQEKAKIYVTYLQAQG